MNPLTQSKKTTILPLLIPLLLACFALLPRAQAVVPAPDGGYLGNNTAEGTNALHSLTTGINNTAVGANALSKTTNGSYNAAFGSRALENNIHGNFNMAVGTQALFNNTGDANLAVGFRTLYFNTTGHDLTGVGAGALYSNTLGWDNTAIGAAALSANTTGPGNTAVGGQALVSNNSGFSNTAVGAGALHIGSSFTFAANTAIGADALANLQNGFRNIALGADAGGNLSLGIDNIDIGNTGVVAEDNTIRIGDNLHQDRTFIAGIYNVSQGGVPLAVTINANGQLGTQAPSSRRFKKEIKPIDQTSEAILGLKPVTFHYKSDSTGTPQFGLIAEEVAEVNPDLVVRDENGEIYTVRYDAVNAMLLNEFLKEHHKVQELEKQVEKLTAGLQKVSDQLEASKPAPQVVNNP